MTRLGVDLELLEDFTRDLAACERQLCAARDGIDAAVRDAHACWQGVAAAAHADAHRRWAAGETEMREAVTALQQICTTAASNYAAAVVASMQTWSS